MTQFARLENATNDQLIFFNKFLQLADPKNINLRRFIQDIMEKRSQMTIFYNNN